MDYDEDRSQIRTASGPRVMASLRNLAITILRLTGQTSIAAALRYHARRPSRPLQTIMIASGRLCRDPGSTLDCGRKARHRKETSAGTVPSMWPTRTPRGRSGRCPVHSAAARNAAAGLRIDHDSRSASGRGGLAFVQPAGIAPSLRGSKGSVAMSATSSQTGSGGVTAAERAAMKQRAAELRAEGKQGAKKADGLEGVLDAIAKMAPEDRAVAERVHATVSATAPELSPRTWYGMPAYAKDGKVVCFFRSAQKFKTRYATFGFSDKANLDEGAMWPTDFALKELTADVEKRIGALVKKAVS